MNTMLEKQLKIALEKNHTYSFKQIARKLNIPPEQNKHLSGILREMVKRNQLIETKDRDYFVPNFEPKEVTGSIKLNPRGFAFLDVNSVEQNFSIFISPDNVNTALDGDTVSVKYFRENGDEAKFQGMVTSVLKRNKDFLIGTVVKNGQYFDFIPVDYRVKSNFRFVDSKNLKHNDQIKAKVIEYHRNYILIDVDKVIGTVEDVSMDILSEILDSGIPYEFSDKVSNAAKSIPNTVQPDEYKGRRDIRDELIVTIDGDDTKDFDDAVTVKKLPNGNYMLGVYIADVTHYVREGDHIDNEAYLRGTSVYLADRVVPMLPFELSNEICSLNPNVDRLVIACDMEIDKQGNTVKYDIYEAVFKSHYRLTYQQCNRFYKGTRDETDQRGEIVDFKDQSLVTMLNNALELSHIIRKYKNREGYVDFDITESKIIINDKGETTDIVVRDRDFSEMLIEDFMVRANECVAKHVADKELSFIYRIHDKPDLERLTELKRVVKILGLDVEIPSVAEPAAFARAIEQLKQYRFDDFMKTMMLRTMAKAVYSEGNIGHFGLASKFYTHFTSPIRRYPDLMVHRMLREYFFKKGDVKKASNHFGTILPEIATHTSLTEQRSMELERRVADIKKAEYYEKMIGKSFEGQITTIKKFGFFIEFPNKVAGLVAANTLLDGRYELASDGLVLESKTRKFTIGDKVTVTVIAAQKHEGKIDLVMTDLYDRWLKEGSKANGKPQRAMQ